MEETAQPSPFEGEEEVIQDFDEEYEPEEGELPADDDYDEYEDEDDDTLDEESDEEDYDDEDDELEDEQDDKPDLVPHAALHKERLRRKELQQVISQSQMQAKSMEDDITEYRKSLMSIRNQVKELGLEDAIDIDEPDQVSDEVREMRQQKETAQLQEQLGSTVDEIRNEAANYLTEYPSIDGDSPEVAEMVVAMALANHTFNGMELEDAVEHSMKLVSTMTTAQVKNAVRRKSPTIRKKVVRAKQTKPKAKSGSVFDNMAGQLLGD